MEKSALIAARRDWAGSQLSFNRDRSNLQSVNLQLAPNRYRWSGQR